MATASTLRTFIQTAFRRALKLGPKAPVRVTFAEDETIRVSVLGREYVMTIGTDDDEFYFKAVDARPVRFPIPLDLA